MANNDGNQSEQGQRSEQQGRTDQPRDGREGRTRYQVHPDDPGYEYYFYRPMQSAGYTPPMTASQHEYRLRNMEMDQLRQELRTCRHRIEEVERQQENQQQGRSGSGRFSSGGGRSGRSGGGGNQQHYDWPYEREYDDYPPRFQGHYPGEDERGYPYSRHQHVPAYVMNPRYQDPRGWYGNDPFVHRIDVDLLT